MATKPKTVIKRVTVALNFPSKITDFILFAKAIYKAMQGNANFTTLAAKLTLLNTDIAALDAAETACSTTPPTSSVDARNVALEEVKSDLRSLRNEVQTMTDANPANAEVIIISASMAIKKPTIAGKPRNTAKDGTEEGSINLTAEGSGPHEWRMSLDETSWTLLPASRTAKTTVSNLTPGTVYFFQNRRMLTKDEKTEWSQNVKIRVK